MNSRFTTSVVEYPDRGKGGSNAWRGNSGPGIITQFVLTYHVDERGVLDKNHLLVDVMKGSDTTGDVCGQLQVPYRGFDLHEGFDAARNDLLTALDGAPAKTVFCHPPYLGMLTYSGSQWGSAPHGADLSHFGTNEKEFAEMLQAVILNMARATMPGGHYALLVGNWRKNGKYYHMGNMVMNLAPDDLAMEIIKRQHNMASNGRQYTGAFVPTHHETLLVFRRAEDNSIFAMTCNTLQRLSTYMSATWRNVVMGAMRSGEAVSAKELVERLEQHPKAKQNANLYAKIRQVLQENPEMFERIARGRYALKNEAAA